MTDQPNIPSEHSKQASPRWMWICIALCLLIPVLTVDVTLIDGSRYLESDDVGYFAVAGVLNFIALIISGIGIREIMRTAQDTSRSSSARMVGSFITVMVCWLALLPLGGCWMIITLASIFPD